VARSLRWDRSNIEYADAVAYSNGFVVEAGFVDEGETVTVAHLTWLAQHVPTVTAEAIGFQIAFGMIMGENGWTAADVPSAWDDTSSDWMYYETGSYIPFPVADDSGVVAEIDLCPDNPNVPRVSRSQRKAPAGGANVWFAINSSALAPTQSRFYLAMSYSIGILEVT
jgi:hypothetical protein